jgi:hypothetical protein
VTVTGLDRVPERPSQKQLRLDLEDAWFEYLAQTKGKLDADYDLCEPWAWAQLQQRIEFAKARAARPPRAWL